MYMYDLLIVHLTVSYQQFELSLSMYNYISGQIIIFIMMCRQPRCLDQF